jgi:hypothetical protein
MRTNMSIGTLLEALAIAPGTALEVPGVNEADFSGGGKRTQKLRRVSWGLLDSQKLLVGLLPTACNKLTEIRCMANVLVNSRW